MKTKLLALILLVGCGSLFAAPHFSIGVGVGPGWGYGYYAPPPLRPAPAYYPPAPGPGYAWVGGYWYPNGARYAWRGGYWSRPPYVGARWVAPRYYGRTYYRGYWRR